MSHAIGNLGAHVPLKIVKGTDASITVTVNEDGAAKDLTGYTAAFVVKRRNKSSADLLSLVPTIPVGTDGQVIVAIADTDTSSWTADDAVYYLNITSAGGLITRVLDGDFDVVFDSEDT